MAHEERTHEYVILTHGDGAPKETGRLWWDGERVRSEPAWLLDEIPEMCSMVGIRLEVDGEMRWVVPRPEHGVVFLETLPDRFRNGYVWCRRVRG